MVEAERALLEGRPSVAVALIVDAIPTLTAKDNPLPLLGACWLGLRAQADIAHVTIPSRRAAGSPGSADMLQIACAAVCATVWGYWSRSCILLVGPRPTGSPGSDSAKQWEAAAEANAELQRPYFRAYCLLRLAAVQLRRQARSAATLALREASETATRLGALTAGHRGRHAGDHRRAAPGHPASTACAGRSVPARAHRKRQILALLKTGATNRVIGRALFISERTASVHVSNILAKLGVANRTEAAQLALRTDLDAGPS